MATLLEKKLMRMEAGTRVGFQLFGAESSQRKVIVGTVADNDHEASIEVYTDTGMDMIISYTDISSYFDPSRLKPEKAPSVSLPPQPTPPKPAPAPQFQPAPPKSAPAPVVSYRIKEPENILVVPDSRFRELFDGLPKDDKKKLTGVFDSFQYGCRINDKRKLVEAAKKAQQELFDADDAGYLWSTRAVLLCTYMLGRADLYNFTVPLLAECFYEASFSCWKEKKYDLSAAYAILALLQDDDDRQEGQLDNLLTLLVRGTILSADASGMHVLLNRLTDELKAPLNAAVNELLAAKRVPPDPGMKLQDAMKTLEKFYPMHGVIKEFQDYWSELPGMEAVPQAAVPAPAAPEPPKQLYGTITYLFWAEQNGKITSDSGETYTFSYADIADIGLRGKIESCMRSDVGGKVYLVRFTAKGSAAKNIEKYDTPVDRARKIFAQADRSDRFHAAYDLCKKALGSSDTSRALLDLVKYADAQYQAEGNLSIIRDALEQYEKYSSSYTRANQTELMDVARFYLYNKQYTKALQIADLAAAKPTEGTKIGNRINFATSYLKLIIECYRANGNRELLKTALDYSTAFAEKNQNDLREQSRKMAYLGGVLPYRVIAECGLEMLEEAERDYTLIPSTNKAKPELKGQLEKLKQRLEPEIKPEPQPEPASEAKPEPQPEPASEAKPEPQPEPASEAKPEPQPEPGSALESSPQPDPEPETMPEPEPELTFLPDPEEEDAEAEEIPPYVDADGWGALALTKKDVVDYAIRIQGEGRIPVMLAYLRAAANLNPELQTVYHTVALAANDPMYPCSYRASTLMEVFADSDTEYSALNDCCMAAALLRTAFVIGTAHDYNARNLCASINAFKQIPALGNACDMLEQFHEDTGRAIDIYADYRNHGSKKLAAELQSTAAKAAELYTKFIATPPREGIRFARLLETKKIVFAKNGYLAVMLKHVSEQDQEALDAERDGFAETFLNESGSFSGANVSSGKIDGLIAESWKRAGDQLQLKKANSTLQGDRRNNLRSNIREILSVICKWYELSEQSAGYTWRTESGEAAYQQTRPQLLSLLADTISACAESELRRDNPQMDAGLSLLGAAAEELSARLDGSWKPGQEKFLYVDFLRTNHVTLDGDYMPELSSTFCVLPEFNILARIRQHAEMRKLSFRKRLEQIYSPSKSLNDYGSAAQILSYLEVMEEADMPSLPENAEKYVEQTEKQADISYQTFRQTYAYALGCGQIIRSDTFCYTLEDTVRYWYAFCRETRNYGFFIRLLAHAENQIHISAQQYEQELEEQLDVLIEHNRAAFDSHPEFKTAIRAQIESQNFTVAENWMARIRVGDFSLDVRQPEALTHLKSFWKNYVTTYKAVSDARRPLSSLLKWHIHNKDSKGAARLIDSWLSNGSPSNPDKIRQLLNLLGWQNITVTEASCASSLKTEIYEVQREAKTFGPAAPLHPIAAFGSEMNRKAIQVVCLYGTYDCDRLFEKLRQLDNIGGSKIILVDYALGAADRRAMARKLKLRESGLRNVYMVIDRVLIAHLARVYNESLINRILMAIAMPFSYYQPYVVESMHTMPPEIFIGRKDELLKIEQADGSGVNLIYGGRQLGKTALLKKAKSDLDGYQNQRAALIDIKGLGCAAAARKISMELIDDGLTPDAEVTEDWGVLCRNIKLRLRSAESGIAYFLLMLDEADDFIKDCEAYNYQPLVELKDVQQTLYGQFKFVLAGLHNIIRFNRQVALGNNSVITHMPYLKITPFQASEAEELLTIPLSYLGFSLPSKVTISHITGTCNYFPGLIQLYAKKLVESVRTPDYAGYDEMKTPPYVVSDAHMRRVMSDREFVEQLYNKLEITLKLDEDQGSYYYPLTLLIGYLYGDQPEKKRSGYTAKDLLSCAMSLQIAPLMGLDKERVSALLQELQDLNVLRSVSSDSYLFASKNFRDLLGSDEEIIDKLSEVGGAAE